MQYKFYFLKISELCVYIIHEYHVYFMDSNNFNTFICNEYLAKLAHKNVFMPVTKVVLKDELSEETYIW